MKSSSDWMRVESRNRRETSRFARGGRYQLTGRRASEDITPPSSLIRAHASDQDRRVRRVSPVPAGGWPFPTLSLQSLRMDPAASLDALDLPREHRPHGCVRHAKLSLQCNVNREPYFGAAVIRLSSGSYAARPPDCIHRSIFVLGGRAVYTTHRPGGYPFRDVASGLDLGHALHQLDCSLRRLLPTAPATSLRGTNPLTGREGMLIAQKLR